MKPSIDPSGTVLLFVVLRQAVRRGVPLGQALRSSTGETGIPREVLASLASEIEGGEPLSDALERRSAWFPPPLPALVAAGERSSRLDETLGRCVELLRRRERTRARVASALVYPAICFAFLVAMLALHAVFDPLGNVASAWMPLRSPLQEYLGFWEVPDRDPARSRPAASRGDQVEAPISFTPWYAAAAVASALGAVWILRRSKVRDRVLLDLPVVGRLHRLAAAAGFTRALAAMLDRGAPVDVAVTAAIPCAGNLWIEERLRQRLDEVRDGEKLASSLALPGVFPPSLRWRMAVGEARGHFAEVLDEAARAFEDESEVRAARVARLIEPAAILGVAIFAVLVLRWILPQSFNLENPWPI